MSSWMTSNVRDIEFIYEDNTVSDWYEIDAMPWFKFRLEKMTEIRSTVRVICGDSSCFISYSIGPYTYDLDHTDIQGYFEIRYGYKEIERRINKWKLEAFLENNG